MLQTPAPRRLMPEERDLARQLLTLMPKVGSRCAPTLRARRLSFERLKALLALERGARRGGELAESWGLTPGAVTLLVDGLVEDGLVTRREDRTDRRVVLLDLTPTGRRELHAVQDAAITALAKGLRALGPAGIARVSAALAELDQALAQRDQP